MLTLIQVNENILISLPSNSTVAMSDPANSPTFGELHNDNETNIIENLEVSPPGITTTAIPPRKDEVQSNDDENIVDFDGDNDPTNPLNSKSIKITFPYLETNLEFVLPLKYGVFCRTFFINH